MEIIGKKSTQKNTHIQIMQRKSFYVILALFWNFKARFARNSNSLKNVFYKSVLELLFTHINPLTPFIFLKNIKIAVPYCAGLAGAAAHAQLHHPHPDHPLPRLRDHRSPRRSYPQVIWIQDPDQLHFVEDPYGVGTLFFVCLNLC